LLKRIPVVNFSQSINQSPNISPNDQHLFPKAVKSTPTKAVKSATTKFASTT